MDFTEIEKKMLPLLKKKMSDNEIAKKLKIRAEVVRAVKMIIVSKARNAGGIGSDG